VRTRCASVLRIFGFQTATLQTHDRKHKTSDLLILENIPYHIRLLHSQNRAHARAHTPIEKVDVSSLVSIVNGHVPRSFSFVRKNMSVLLSVSAPIDVMHEPIS